MSNLQG